MYNAPLEDMQFLIDDVCRAGERLGYLPQFEGLEVGSELTTALLEEAGKLAADMVSPLRRVGDQQPARCADGAVTIPPGYGDAIKALGEGGWVGISAKASHGGSPSLGAASASPLRRSEHFCFSSFQTSTRQEAPAFICALTMQLPQSHGILGGSVCGSAWGSRVRRSFRRCGAVAFSLSSARASRPLSARLCQESGAGCVARKPAIFTSHLYALQGSDFLRYGTAST